MKNFKKVIIEFIVCVLFLSTVAAAQEVDKVSAASIIKTTLNEFGIEAARTKFKEIYAEKDKYSVLQSDLLILGNNLRREGKTKESITVLNMTIEFFPNSDQAYLELGRSYRSLGLDKKDLESTNRAFEIRNAKLLKDFISKNKDSIAKNAKEVIDNYFEAIGGKDNLLKIKTIKLTLIDLNAVNQEVAFLRYYKYPYYYRQTIVSSGNSNVIDGKKVWRVTSEGWKETPQSNFRYTPDIYSDFINYKKRCISYKLLGIEAIDSQIMYRLLKTYEDGHTREFYFSAESSLVVMERRDFGIGKDIKQYFDWREVNGILFPHLFVVTNKVGLGHTHGAITKEIKINEPLDDSLFKEQIELDREASENLNNFPKLTGPYLGQKPPGKIPEIFAPGMVCTDLDEYGCTFSLDGKQFYFTRTFINPRKHVIMVSKLEEKGWTKPQKISFTKNHSQGEPQFTPDGNKLLFGRLEIGADNKSLPFIWIAPYRNGHLGQPQPLMAGMYATAASNGNLYYTDVSKGMEKGDIVMSSYRSGKYLPAKILGSGLNSSFQDAHPFVAADESYVIFDSNRPGGLGNNDLYVCFGKNDGSWGEAINLGAPINTENYDAIPYITPDKRYLFFYRIGDISWVDAKIIEELKPEKLRRIK